MVEPFCFETKLYYVGTHNGYLYQKFKTLPDKKYKFRFRFPRLRQSYNKIITFIAEFNNAVKTQNGRETFCAPITDSYKMGIMKLPDVLTVK